jgi:hypothetical protein
MKYWLADGVELQAVDVVAEGSQVVMWLKDRNGRFDGIISMIVLVRNNRVAGPLMPKACYNRPQATANRDDRRGA